MGACVYAITNTTNGKSYVGKSRDLAMRWRKHRHDAGGLSVPRLMIGKAIRKHGLGAFRFEVLEEFGTDAEAAEWESWWIQYLGTLAPNGYNVALSGHVNIYTASTRAKISASKKGQRHSVETRAKMSASRMGHETSDATRAKISEAHRGRAFSPERCARQSTAQKNSRRTAEVAAKRRGVPLSQEHRAKLAAAKRGRKLSPEHCRKLSEAQLRRHGKRPPDVGDNGHDQ